ncbi:30S ribosomal protein S1 [Candidatus Comchoanobacter bicostacola]|uniref:30S ribosomal protein S1 n=1 Tax=Candidatus Comchoanobacter bicostacola TaxID=2919598 RepID=A0ABY5DJY3_9GAMM|nr:30S ribosomal protein S1 [Candidatus Comchoanobacter bicostacola]UTC24176.1 30S ribosomal protein S1 [Candidatus Comchoanobacter bicostacola]
MSDKSFEQLVASLPSYGVRSGSLVKGRVVSMSNDYVTVDVGLKSEALVPFSEFVQSSNEDVSEGTELDFLLETIDNGFGETCVSLEKAIRLAVWNRLENALKSEENVVGQIIDRVKGGFTVNIDGVRAFLPGSQVDLRPIKDLDMVASQQEFEFKVVKMDKKRNNVVVSRRAVIEEETSGERAELLNNLTEGQEVKGVVKNLTDYGAFIDLGGIDGLLHILDMSWKRIKHPSEMLKVHDDVVVKVLSFDREKKRVSLGLKQLQGDPWKDLLERNPVKSRLFGRVTNITEYGCFVEIEDGIEGLVHMSEMDWTNKNIHPSKVVEIDQEIEVMVLDIDESRRRISLGIKQCMLNPWDEFRQNHEIGSRVKGAIRSITDFGIFIGLEGSIDGLVHLTDLSWVLPGEKALHSYKKGQEVEAIILAIDSDRERISLGLKQLDVDPFDQFISSNPVGSSVSGKVLSLDARKVVVALDAGISGSVKRSEFDESEALQEGDELALYVVSDERRNQMVLLSRMNQSEFDNSGSGSASTFGDLMKGHLDSSK